MSVQIWGGKSVNFSMPIKGNFKYLFSLLGISVSRIKKEFKTSESIEKTSDWFIFDKSCQIPNLSFIYQQIFGKHHRGLLVEIGAFDGVSFSNSVGLLDRGWEGLLIEPVPDFAKKCEARHDKNPRVRVIQTAISNQSGTQSLQLAGPLSTLSEELVTEYKELEWSKSSISSKSIKVQTVTLDQLLEKEKISTNFDLLIVDVEGFEKEVFEGFELEKWKPNVLIIELSDFHPMLESHKKEHFRLGESLAKSGYSVIFKDSTNTILVRTELLTRLFSD